MGARLRFHQEACPYVSIPRRVASRLCNSYTLESLDGVLLPGLYNTRRLHAFEPWDGTRLASEEMAWLEEHAGNDGVNELEDDDSVTRSVQLVLADHDEGVTTKGGAPVVASEAIEAPIGVWHVCREGGCIVAVRLGMIIFLRLPCRR